MVEWSRQTVTKQKCLFCFFNVRALGTKIFDVFKYHLNVKCLGSKQNHNYYFVW